MIDTELLERLAAEPGGQPDLLLARVDRSLRRRSRLRALAGGAAALVVVLVGTGATSLLGSRSVARAPEVAALPSPEGCPAALASRARQLAAAALAATAIAACSDAGPAAGDGPDQLEQGAVLEVTGDPELAGTHAHAQISEALLLEIPGELAEREDLELGAFAVTIEFLDDDFDWVRLGGSVGEDGRARLFPSFRIAGVRFEGPECETILEQEPPGPTSGTFTCREAVDTSGDRTVTVVGRFRLTDLQVRDFG